jgi:hypothetical protein
MTVRKSICLRPAEYEALNRYKTAYERANGSSTDWGAFLVLILGLVIGAKLLDEVSQNNQRGGDRNAGT